MDVAGVEVDAVRGKPQGVAPEPLQPGLLLAFVRGEVGADEGVEEPSRGSYQTPRYALALHEAQNVRTEADVIASKVDARLKRQAILERSPALHLWVVLDDAVLRRCVGSTDVMAEQIDHLQSMAQRPNVDVQVLQFAAGAHAAGSGGHFLILGRDDEGDPLNSMNVVYLEFHKRGLYLDAPADVQSYKLMFDYLRSQAADTSASLEPTHSEC